jgi:hypothetical protein
MQVNGRNSTAWPAAPARREKTLCSKQLICYDKFFSNQMSEERSMMSDE